MPGQRPHGAVPAKSHVSACPRQSSSVPPSWEVPLRVAVARCWQGWGGRCGREGRSETLHVQMSLVKPRNLQLPEGTRVAGGKRAWVYGNVEGIFSFVRAFVRSFIRSLTHSLSKLLLSTGLGSGPPQPLSGTPDMPVESALPAPPSLPSFRPMPSPSLTVAALAFLLLHPSPHPWSCPSPPSLYRHSLHLLKISLHHRAPSCMRMRAWSCSGLSHRCWHMRACSRHLINVDGADERREQG